MPKLSEGASVTVSDAEVFTKKTKPPRHFTEGTLIKALENIYKYVDDEKSKKLLKEEDGIGTPATRSDIISELKRRGYLETKGKNLLATDEGRSLVSALPESVTSAVLTAQYERQLKEIQNGSGKLDEFLRTQIDYVSEQVDKSGEAVKSVYRSNAEFACDCGGSLVRRKKGERYWWGCSAYPECKNTYNDVNGKPNLKKKPATKGVETEHKCAKCEKPLIARKSARGKTWYGCSGFPACKERYFQKAGQPDYG